MDLTLRPGEILGIAGLVGAGRSDLARAIFGADPVESGTIVLEGKSIAPASPQDAIRAGIREFDFLRGNEPYKYLWGARDRYNQRWLARHAMKKGAPGRAPAQEEAGDPAHGASSTSRTT